LSLPHRLPRVAAVPELCRDGDGVSLQGPLCTEGGRLGTVDEVTEAVIFLADERSSFCNGTPLLLDGGLRASLF
jgi:NAD(P)-dependent dehydrogenase (short-subunit alcohol dehydrogenase family)